MSQTTISPPNPYMDAAIYERLAHRYAPVLDKARTFLGKKGTTKNGGTNPDLRKKTPEEPHKATSRTIQTKPEGLVPRTTV